MVCSSGAGSEDSVHPVQNVCLGVDGEGTRVVVDGWIDVCRVGWTDGRKVDL